MAAQHSLFTDKTILDSTAYRVTSAVFNAVTHGIGLILALIATVLLVLKGIANGSTLEIVSYLIYGISLAVLYFHSMMYHSLSFTTVAPLFQFLDHASIYLLIAGTYTPFCLLAIRGVLGWGLAVLEWALALIGFIGEASGQPWIKRHSLWFYLGMGWLALLAIVPLVQHLPLAAIAWLLAGGLLYSVGTYFYRFDDQVAYYHVLWHLFVLAGSAAMFVAIYRYL